MSHTQAGRRRIGEATKLRWAEGQMSHTPESRRRISEASKARWDDPEYRKKQSESRRQAWARRKAEWASKVELATVKFKCENCESEFVPLVTRRGSSAQKYCSEKCRDTAYMRRKRARPEYKARIRDRYEHDSKFREKRRADWERWRKRNPEKAKAARLKWVSKNLEHLAEYKRLRREKNPEKFRQQQRDYWRRLRDAARHSVLAAPKRRGRPQGTEGRMWRDTEQKITFCALCKLQGMSARKISRLKWPGPHVAESTKKSFLQRHKSDITTKMAEVSALSKARHNAIVEGLNP